MKREGWKVKLKEAVKKKTETRNKRPIFTPLMSPKKDINTVVTPIPSEPTVK